MQTSTSARSTPRGVGSAQSLETVTIYMYVCMYVYIYIYTYIYIYIYCFCCDACCSVVEFLTKSGSGRSCKQKAAASCDPRPEAQSLSTAAHREATCQGESPAGPWASSLDHAAHRGATCQGESPAGPWASSLDQGPPSRGLAARPRRPARPPCKHRQARAQHVAWLYAANTSSTLRGGELVDGSRFERRDPRPLIADQASFQADIDDLVDVHHCDGRFTGVRHCDDLRAVGRLRQLEILHGSFGRQCERPKPLGNCVLHLVRVLLAGHEDDGALPILCGLLKHTHIFAHVHKHTYISIYIYIYIYRWGFKE